VLARNGERVRLQHIRLGGRIFTTRAWLEAFGQQLADADARYFDLNQAISSRSATANISGRPQLSDHRRRAIEDAERELDRAGI
jgi:hypothetical protein